MSTLRIRIERRPDEQELVPGLPIVVRPVASSGALKDRPIQAVAPLSDTETYSVSLAPGRYEVQVVMPAGEIREARTTLTTIDEDRLVVLEAGEIADRDLAYFDLTQQISDHAYRKIFKAHEFAFVEEDVASIGPRIESAGSQDSFPAHSWEGWRDWLDDRAVRADRAGAPPLQLRCDGGVRGLRVEAVDEDGRLGRVQVYRHFGEDRVQLRAAGAQRAFLSVQHAQGVRVLSLPWPWPADGVSARDGELLEIVWKTEANRLSWSTSLADRRYGGLLAYLSTGQVGRAGILFRNIARDALFLKMQHPLGAALGGYVLLSTEDDAERRGWDDWPEWLTNLSNWFPRFPDGPILRARWLLTHQPTEASIQSAREHLLSSFDRGVPFFSAGVTWLIEGLRALAVDCETCAARLQTVRGVARSMDLTQPFVTFELRRPVGQTGPDLMGLNARLLPAALGLGLDGVDYSRNTRLTARTGMDWLELDRVTPPRRETEQE